MPQHTRWNTETLWQQLQPLLPGLSIEVVARIDSTNSQLLERARLHSPRDGEGRAAFGRREGDTHPCLLVAEHQTGGRGRMGRQWKASPGASLTFSLSMLLQRADWSGLSLAVGLALAEAIEPQPARLRLKWPNDLMLADADGGARKLGGVLIESVAVGAQRMAVVGVGLNVLRYDVGELPQGFACVQELLADATPPRLLAQVLPALAHALTAFERDGLAPFAERFAARDLLRGRRVDTTPGGVTGEADGVDDSGALRVLDANGDLRLISSGEVSVRLTAAGG